MNLSFVSYVDSTTQTETSDRPPKGVVIAGDCWFFRGGCFAIGFGVRVPNNGEDVEWHGPAWVGDISNPRHREVLTGLQADLAAGTLRG